jgi:hypothetical protein
MSGVESTFSESTLKSFQASYAQYGKFCEEKKMKKDTTESVKAFLLACAEGWPNDRPKKPVSLKIKYKGISHLVVENTGGKVTFTENFFSSVIQ